MDVLLCLAPAGAGPSFFTPWLGSSSRLDVVPLCLPGREGRFAEDPPLTVPLLAASVLAAAEEAIEHAGHTLVFGHSFGAVVAYELSRLLEARGHGGTLTLVASGSAAPGTAVGAKATGLPDAEFVATVGANAGYSHPAFDDPDLAELLLPAMRADVAAYEGYRPAWPTPATFPIVTLRGDRDGLVSAAETARWSGVTSADVRAFELEGAHMYVVDRWPAVLEVMEQVVAESSGTSGVN
jgi:surfactin synthase thioesterase subunit